MPRSTKTYCWEKSLSLILIKHTHTQLNFFQKAESGPVEPLALLLLHSRYTKNVCEQRGINPVEDNQDVTERKSSTHTGPTSPLMAGLLDGSSKAPAQEQKPTQKHTKSRRES